MSADADAVRRWAATHAATVVAAARPPASESAAPPASAQTVLVSWTEIPALSFAGIDDRSAVAWGYGLDGLPRLATGGEDGIARIWDPGTGQPLYTLNGHNGVIWAVAWGDTTDGQPRLATGGEDGTARIWDPGTGQLLHTLSRRPNHKSRYTASVLSVAWGYQRCQPGGQLLLATGNGDGTARIWDPGTGQLLHTLDGHARAVNSVAWGYRPTGESMLAVCAGDATRIWDPITGRLLEILSCSPRAMSVAWGYRTDGYPRLAVGSHEGSAYMWTHDGTGFTSQALTEESVDVVAVSWAPLSDGRSMLAAASPGGLSVWDGATGRLLHIEPHQYGGRADDLYWSQDPAGRLLLAAPAVGGQVRVWEALLDPPAAGGRAADAEGAPDYLGAGRAAGLTRELLLLGQSGLWPPLGLLADLVEITGPDDRVAARTADDAGHTDPKGVAALCDPRLGALANEPGVARLRAVGWESAARVSMAALVASAMAIPEQFTPPDGISAETLHDALTHALTEESTPAWQASIGGLRAAVARITDQTIALLQILGRAACAADPMLPVRFAHRIPQLPALTPSQLHLLTGVVRPTAASLQTASGTLIYRPGTADVTRTGPPTRLLTTQLALPPDLMTIRRAATQLLYRQHRAPAPPVPESLTIILDTTPPTYGPAGNTLRLACHLITAALHDYDRSPLLITLTDPDAVTELRAPADLLALWTSATLDDPGHNLTTAVATAAEAGRPTVLATHPSTARDSRYRPSPATRLLTAHQPPDHPPPLPDSPWHAHLPPHPTQAQLAAAIGPLIARWGG